MGAYKPKNANEYKNINYDEQSSSYGHYKPEIIGKRYGRDGSMAPVTQMRWVEDDRKFEAPPIVVSEPESNPAPQEPTQLSETAARANAQADAYEKTLMTRDGSNIFANDKNVIADFNTLSATNFADEIAPKMPNELKAARSNAYAQNYADDYKLALSDQLKSGTARLELMKNFNA
tara:strand:- start:52 stop:579 length:528 start_codon:yes stop_codon:yes gene_type:complete